MTQHEQLHQELLLFESPMASEQERAAQSRRVCRAARKLLREDYGLDGDFPADAAVESDKSERQQRVLATPGLFEGHDV